MIFHKHVGSMEQPPIGQYDPFVVTFEQGKSEGDMEQTLRSLFSKRGKGRIFMGAPDRAKYLIDRLDGELVEAIRKAPGVVSIKPPEPF